MKQTLIIVASLLVYVLNASASGPHLRFIDRDTLDLGTFYNTEVRSGEVAVVNDGDSTLVIMQTFTDCSCTKTRASAKNIAPGDTAVIKVIFDGHGRRHGGFTKIVRLRTNDAVKPVHHIIVKGQIARPWRKNN